MARLQQLVEATQSEETLLYQQQIAALQESKVRKGQKRTQPWTSPDAVGGAPSLLISFGFLPLRTAQFAASINIIKLCAFWWLCGRQ